MRKILYFTISLLVVYALSSCNHKFDGYNKDPNRSPQGEVHPSAMMKALIYYSTDGFLYRTWLLNGELMQYTVSGTTNNAYHRYMIQSGITAGVWNHLTKYAANANEMYYLAEKYELPDYMAIALTMKVLLMSNLTDIFGDIPYSEAFNILENVRTPVFDTQEEVYRQMLEELEEANKLYTGNKLTSPGTDILYNGDTDKWRKFTNSLHLRLLMRLSNRDYHLGISQKLKEFLADPATYPIFTSNDDNAELKYSGVTPFENRFGGEPESSFNGRRMAEYFIEYMKETVDPRIGWFAYRGSNADFLGVVSGMPIEETDLGSTSVLNKALIGNYSSPYALMKYDEVLFIFAEAAHREMIGGGATAAEDYYDRAVRASIAYWDGIPAEGKVPVTNAALEIFMNNIRYNNSLENIMLQKYVAMFWVGYEAWHDYRRTGYPILPIGTAVVNDGVLPTRFVYPTTTYRTNTKNCEEAVSRMANNYVDGADNMRTPVWWSKRAFELAK